MADGLRELQRWSFRGRGMVSLSVVIAAGVGVLRGVEPIRGVGHMAVAPAHDVMPAEPAVVVVHPHIGGTVVVIVVIVSPAWVEQSVDGGVHGQPPRVFGACGPRRNSESPYLRINRQTEVRWSPSARAAWETLPAVAASVWASSTRRKPSTCSENVAITPPGAPARRPTRGSPPAPPRRPGGRRRGGSCRRLERAADRLERGLQLGAPRS